MSKMSIIKEMIEKITKENMKRKDKGTGEVPKEIFDMEANLVKKAERMKKQGSNITPEKQIENAKGPEEKRLAKKEEMKAKEAEKAKDRENLIKATAVEKELMKSEGKFHMRKAGMSSQLEDKDVKKAVKEYMKKERIKKLQDVPAFIRYLEAAKEANKKK